VRSDDELRTGFPEERRPGGGIEFLLREERDEVLVTEFVLRAEVFDMPLAVGAVHVFFVPFVVMGRHGIETQCMNRPNLAS